MPTPAQRPTPSRLQWPCPPIYLQGGGLGVDLLQVEAQQVQGQRDRLQRVAALDDVILAVVVVAWAWRAGRDQAPQLIVLRVRAGVARTFGAAGACRADQDWRTTWGCQHPQQPGVTFQAAQQLANPTMRAAAFNTQMLPSQVTRAAPCEQYGLAAPLTSSAHILAGREGGRQADALVGLQAGSVRGKIPHWRQAAAAGTQPPPMDKDNQSSAATCSPEQLYHASAAARRHGGGGDKR